MATHNAENERIKRRYFAYVKEAKRFSEPSIDAVAKALSRFETYTRLKPFKAFRMGQAIGFKRHLATQLSVQTKQRLSKATIYSTLTALRNFFHWLAGQPGFRSRLTYSDAEYLNPSGIETAVAKSRRERPVPSLDQINHILRTMPATTETELRDRAVVAITILTSARDGAIASLKLKHIDTVARRLDQDANDVHTKFHKTQITAFFPVGDLPEQILIDWVEHLQTKKLWGPDDPLFPATGVGLDAERRFHATGLARKHWSTSTPIRSIFKKACENAGLPYFNPHSFRKTVALLGEKLCITHEDMKAWSQNMGHTKVATTLSSYGTIPFSRQAAVIKNLSIPTSDAEDVRHLVRQLTRAIERGAPGNTGAISSTPSRAVEPPPRQSPIEPKPSSKQA